MQRGERVISDWYVYETRLSECALLKEAQFGTLLGAVYSYVVRVTLLCMRFGIAQPPITRPP